MTVRAITNDELIKLRAGGQYAEVFAIPRIPNVIYTAQLDTTPTSTDLVAQIAVTGGSGTAANILPDMKMLVGTSAGADDLGFCRVRATPTLPSGIGNIKIGELSHIDWQAGCHLTIVDDYDIFPRHLRIVSGEAYTDHENDYTDQHTNFDPIVNMGGHRVLLLEGATVQHVRRASTSQVFDGSIASYLHSAPGAASITNETTADATITYDTEGHFCEYLTLTSNNGKTWRGVRYVFVIDPANLESKIRRLSVREGADGVSANFEMIKDASLSNFRKRAFVIIFSRDYYGGEQESIGYNEYEENIIASGRISDERPTWNDEVGTVEFVIQNWKYWMSRLPTFPFGIERIISSAPDAWTNMAGVTVDRAIWALLHEYCTVTRICDFHPSGDARYAAELASTNSNLDAQVEEIATTSIFADLVFDRFGSAWLRIEPQLVPESDRSGWAVVQAITSRDYQGALSSEINAHEETSQINLSGVSVPQFGSASPHFSLSYGRIFAPFGDPRAESNLLLQSQDQSNSLTGLVMGWENRLFDSLGIEFIGMNRMFSIAEYCRAYIQITPSDNPRGIAYDGYLCPRSIAYDYEEETGFFTTVIEFQDESIERISVTGDFPAETGMDDIDFSTPPMPKISIPPIVAIPMSPLVDNPNHPIEVAIGSRSSTAKGMYFTRTFDKINPEWFAFNGGIHADDVQYPLKLVVTPSKSLYLLTNNGVYSALYRCPAIGGEWTQLYRNINDIVESIAVNPNKGDELCFITTSTSNVSTVRFARGTALSSGTTFNSRFEFIGDLTFLNNSWFYFASATGVFATPWGWKISAGGGSVTLHGNVGAVTGQDAAQRFAIPLSDKIMLWDAAAPAGFTNLPQSDFTAKTRNTDFNPAKNSQGASVSPTGTNIMGATHVGTTFIAHLSTDGGASWSPVSGVIPNGSDTWENCGDSSRWIFGGGTVIRLTTDRGASYVDKMGNLATIAPLIDVSQIRYING